MKYEITPELFTRVQQVLDLINKNDDGANTHGPLDVQKLIEMLLEDIALMLERPGSWEGVNMAQIMTSHGYK